jgi:excisionase family DNA binding protein
MSSYFIVANYKDSSVDQTNMEQLLTVGEAAALLRLSPRTLYNLVARDQIPVQRVRRRVMFRPSALQRWLDAQARPVEVSEREA